jgi:hypothetical protein
MIDPNRAAPDQPGVADCCKLEGNLNWQVLKNEAGEDLPGRYVGICRTCGKKHYRMVVSEMKKQEN